MSNHFSRGVLIDREFYLSWATTKISKIIQLSTILLTRQFIICGFCPGVNSDGATPLPIPNREVKPISPDDTRAARFLESRTTLGLNSQKENA